MIVLHMLILKTSNNKNLIINFTCVIKKTFIFCYKIISEMYYNDRPEKNTVKIIKTYL